MSFTDKVIAITGAASGIGRALAQHLASHGARLALADIQADALNTLVEVLKGDGVTVAGTVVDVSSTAAVDDWISTIMESFNKLDGIAHAAGIEMAIANVEITDDEVWDKQIAVNLMGTVRVVRAAVRVMKPGGSIVTIASQVGLSASRPGLGAHVAVNQGVVALIKTVTKEVSKKGIRVNAIAAGSIDTPMLHRALEEARSSSSASSAATFGAFQIPPMVREGSADEVARSIAFLLSDDSSYTTGAVLNVDGGAGA